MTCGQRQGALEGVGVTAAFLARPAGASSQAPRGWSAAGWSNACWRAARTWSAWCGTGCRNPNWSAPRDIERVKVVRGDVRDRDCVERSLGEYEIDTVFHLAAQTIVGIANRNPVSTFESNIQGTWNLLEACRRSPAVKSIVVASSDKAYGDQAVLPYSEDTPLQGQHPYDVSKSCADLIAHTYAVSYQLPVAITRCGNFYGGGDLNWNRIVPGTIRSVLRGERPIIRSDGNYIRDYFYVEDGAAAYMTLAEALAKRPELARRGFQFLERTANLRSRILSSGFWTRWAAPSNPTFATRRTTRSGTST